jgi:hypothetical protein
VAGGELGGGAAAAAREPGSGSGQVPEAAAVLLGGGWRSGSGTGPGSVGKAVRRVLLRVRRQVPPPQAGVGALEDGAAVDGEPKGPVRGAVEGVGHRPRRPELARPPRAQL